MPELSEVRAVQSLLCSRSSQPPSHVSQRCPRDPPSSHVTVMRRARRACNSKAALRQVDPPRPRPTCPLHEPPAPVELASGPRKVRGPTRRSRRGAAAARRSVRRRRGATLLPRRCRRLLLSAGRVTCGQLQLSLGRATWLARPHRCDGRACEQSAHPCREPPAAA